MNPWDGTQAYEHIEKAREATQVAVDELGKVIVSEVPGTETLPPTAMNLLKEAFSNLMNARVFLRFDRRS